MQGDNFNPLRCSTGCCRLHEVLRELDNSARNGCRSTALSGARSRYRRTARAAACVHEIARAVPGLKIMLATYSADSAPTATRQWRCRCRVCTSTSWRAPEQLDDLASMPNDRLLSLGIIDGRNIWPRI